MLLLEVPLLIGTLLYLHLALPGHRSAQRRLSWGRNKLAGRAGPQELLDIGQELEEQNHHQDRDEVSDGAMIPISKRDRIARSLAWHRRQPGIYPNGWRRRKGSP